jgi:hypothetical protein
VKDILETELWKTLLQLLGERWMMTQDGMLPFTIDEQPLKERLTARAGLPLIVEMFRSLGLPAVVGAEVRLKERNRGFTEAEMVEEYVMMLVAGGECLNDFSVLAGDEGLDVLLGRKRPSPEASRDFLNKFHDEKMEEKRPSGPKAWIPPETPPLIGLGKVNQKLIRSFGERVPTQRITATCRPAWESCPWRRGPSPLCLPPSWSSTTVGTARPTITTS